MCVSCRVAEISYGNEMEWVMETHRFPLVKWHQMVIFMRGKLHFQTHAYHPMPKWQDFDQRISRYEMPCCCSATGNRCRTASCERMRVCEFKCQNPSLVKLNSRSCWWNPNSLTIVIELHPSFSHWNLIFLSGISISWGKSPIVLNWTTPIFPGEMRDILLGRNPCF